MNDTKTRQRTHFRHPAIEELDREKAALRIVLRAMSKLDSETAINVLKRAERAAVFAHALACAQRDAQDPEADAGDPDAC